MSELLDFLLKVFGLIPNPQDPEPAPQIGPEIIHEG